MDVKMCNSSPLMHTNKYGQMWFIIKITWLITNYLQNDWKHGQVFLWQASNLINKIKTQNSLPVQEIAFSSRMPVALSPWQILVHHYNQYI